mgnify:CR=1 FL=1
MILAVTAPISASAMVFPVAMLSVERPPSMSSFVAMSALALNVTTLPPRVMIGTAPLRFIVVTVPVPTPVKLAVCAGTFKVPIAADAGIVSFTVSVHAARSASMVAVVITAVPVAVIVIALAATAPSCINAMVLAVAMLRVDTPELMSSLVLMALLAFKVVIAPPTVTVRLKPPSVSVGIAPVVFIEVIVPVPAVVKLVVWAGMFSVPIASVVVLLSLTVSVHAVRSASIVTEVITAVLTAEIVMALAFTALISASAIIRPVAILSVVTLALISNFEVIL